ncbi:archaeosortase/exosortase family protein [Methylomarinum vadi]|uniref:archaeosortase/exosortase family protein n=1 Tax=Methylomarinum vadi TaxID=438855 RepID=UPI00068D40F7|nr:archaeosortase/exosortase family protein [Methylomarinum vadi]
MITAQRFICWQLLAYWPVWRWYGQRLLDRSDEPWGILALATVLIIVAKKGLSHVPSRKTLVVATLLALLYAFGYAYLPPLLRAAIAALALAVTLSGFGYARTVQAGVAGLLLLSLPLIASLQFYGGFPIRTVTAFVSSMLLNLAGYEVRPQGTLLYWLGETIAVDAPCAGIKMLWTALYLNFMLAAWRGMSFVKTWLGTSFTMFSVFIGNILRATLLFFTESGLVAAPEIAHSLLGVLVFAVVALAVLGFHRRNLRTSTCVA